MQARPHAPAISRLPSPDELRTRLPRGSGAAAVVKDARRSIADVLHGHDPVRLVVIVGPCSLHDSEAALLYAERLRAVARDTSECLVIAMRTYLEKPRTARGWKGLLKDPHMDESCDLAQGLELGRQLLCSINELGLPCASELLDPMTPSYIADLLLLRAHRDTYPAFWRWVQAAVDRAMLTGTLHSVFGWQIHVDGEANPRSLMNFPMQANGAEILRLACCLMTELGIDVCAPVHDAVLVEADADAIDDVVQAAQAAMREASEVVLDGFGLRTDASVVRPPDRYMDKRGAAMWKKVTGILRGIRDRSCCANAHPVVASAQQDLLRERTPALSYVL